MHGIAVATVPEHATAPKDWSIGLRIAFRFACLYWIAYAALNVAYRSPAGQIVSRLYMASWRQFWLWATVHVFHITGDASRYVPTPSGDTTLQYVQQAMFLMIALGGAVVWSILDRRRTEYRALHSWVSLLMRYALALILFTYGFSKLFPQQFPPLTFARLMEPYGEFSPMGALWSFMSASRPYAVFAGASEVIGATLLLFRRTTTLGALVAAIAMTNVVALNFSYDVPVKLYSTNILLMAVFLLVPDLRRLANVLVFNRPTAAADLSRPRFERRSVRIAASVCWVVFLGYSLGQQVAGNIAEYRSLYKNPNRPPLLGLFRVENDYQNWRAVALDDPRTLPAAMNGASMTVRTKDDIVYRFVTTWKTHQLILNGRDAWTWSQPDSDHVVLEMGSDTIRLRKVDTANLPLLSRGFHWINETAFNY